MKKLALIKAALQAKMEINDQIDEFIDHIERRTDDPNDFVDMIEFEKIRRTAELATHKTYSDLSSKMLSAIDTKELQESKKANSSRQE